MSSQELLNQETELVVLFIRRNWHETKINAGVWSHYSGYSQALL